GDDGFHLMGRRELLDARKDVMDAVRREHGGTFRVTNSGSSQEKGVSKKSVSRMPFQEKAIQRRPMGSRISVETAFLETFSCETFLLYCFHEADSALCARWRRQARSHVLRRARRQRSPARACDKAGKDR